MQGIMAEWLGEGLQNLLRRFDSVWYLEKHKRQPFTLQWLAFMSFVYDSYQNSAEQQKLLRAILTFLSPLLTTSSPRASSTRW